MDNDKDAPSNSDGEIVVADEATTRLTILKSIAAGAIVFGIPGMMPKAASAGPIRFVDMGAVKGPITYMNLDGLLLVKVLQQAGLDPKQLNLQALLGDQFNRADINELEKRLTGQKSTEWHITITIEFK